MNLLKITTLVLFLASQALANDVSQVVEKIDALNSPNSKCIDCDMSAMAGHGSDSSDYIEYPFLNKDFGSGKTRHDCTKYINNRDPGKLGEKGKTLVGYMKNYPEFTTDSPTADMKNICPNFSKFSTNQKLHFWVWFWAALSIDESGCGHNTHNANGTNGAAVGDFQMELSLKLRNGAGRPKPACYKGDIRQFDGNASCAVAIMNKQLINRNKLFGTTSYWQKLNKSSSNVLTLTKKYPGCK